MRLKNILLFAFALLTAGVFLYLFRYPGFYLPYLPSILFIAWWAVITYNFRQWETTLGKVWGIMTYFIALYLPVSVIIAESLLHDWEMLLFIFLFLAGYSGAYYILSGKKIMSEPEQKYRLYRWVIAAILVPHFTSGWAAWKATNSVPAGLAAFMVVFFAPVFAASYLLKSYTPDVFYFKWFGMLSGYVLAFIILGWAWMRVPVEMKVYGWEKKDGFV